LPIILYEEVGEEIAQKAAKTAWKPLESLFQQRFGELYTWVEANLNPWASELHSPPMWKKLWQMVRYRPLEAVAFLLFAVIVGVMPLIEQRLADLQLPAAVLAVASVVVAVVRTYNQWNQLLAESYEMYQERVNQERERIAGEREERVKKILADQRAAAELAGKTKHAADSPVPGADEGMDKRVPNIPIIEREIARLEAQIKRQRQRVGITADHVSLLDFVSSRLDEAFYEKELGLMHQVQRDLRELSNGIAAQIEDLFPRGKARVVLYIDDLDRCPPHRVVEVLEAVQLLLKTKLFVVVLAIDARFITRALETAYAGILTRRGKPSGLDYVEKIIQIPYHVQSIDTEAVGRYLSAQLEVNTLSQEDSGRPISSVKPEGPDAPENGEGSEPIAPPVKVLPSEVLKIEQEEYDYLLKCCQAINLTPRAIKRLANVYKIIQIIWFRNQSRPSAPHGVELVILLPVLAERYPDLMRELFDEIEIKVRAELEAPELLKDIFQEHKLQAENGFLKRECERLQGDVKKLLPDIKLSEIDMRSFNLVRSFCFVSDLGYDPVEEKGWRP
jgi:hypothetical protein